MSLETTWITESQLNTINRNGIPMKSRPFFLVLLAGIGAMGGASIGCQQIPSETVVDFPKQLAVNQEGVITVQHILIKWDKAGRSKSDAEKLAKDLLQRAQGGQDFNQLVKDFNEDPGGGGGYYTMADHGVKVSASLRGVSKRMGMVKGFGDVSFSLEPGEVGIANFDNVASPFGWHIIKRIK